MAKESNIIRHPRRLPFGFVTAVFLLMLGYIGVHIFLFFTRTKIQVYEVPVAEADSISASFTGMLLRDELLYASDAEGYLNYLAVPEDRLSVGTQVVILDRDGNLEEELHRFYYGQDILKNSSILTLQNTIKNAQDSYDPQELSSLRHAKSLIRQTVFRALLEDGGTEILNQLSHDITGTVKTGKSGFFVLYRDGYESRSPVDLSLSDFSRDHYHREVRNNGDYVQEGEFLYKIVSDNKFTLVFPLTEEQKEILSKKRSLTVRLPDGDEITGQFSVKQGRDGTNLGVLFFQKYGGNYLDERLVEFKLKDQSAEGYKIPESALVSKNYYVVDESFITKGGDSGSSGVLKKNGDSADFVKASVIYRTEDPETNLVIGNGNAYIYADDLKAGDTIMIDVENGDGTITHKEATLAVMASVDGVYQINYGYCIFKPVLKIQASLESSFVMVYPNLSGTIRPYDRIVMDPSHVEENEIIYE